MSNQLKMADIQAILSLRAQGRSFREIARQLGVYRETAARYVHQAAAAPDPASALPGAEAPLDSKPASALAGSSTSQCQAWRDLILAKAEAGLTARRIWQDLQTELGCSVSYYSVCRFSRKLSDATPLPMRRMECLPGEEAQIDFGTGAPIIAPDGKRRKTHVFRIVLSHSRKAYSEVCWRQTTEEFIRVLVIDNLRACVSQPDWFDPELNPKLMSFCRHYGTVILPTKPRTPRHKGKVERGIGYVKGNALKARTFESLEAQNRHLLHWEESVADTRIHGTTKRHVGQVFTTLERAALLPLPAERFPFFHEAQRIVSRDGHIEVAKAYYSVPPEYLARQVWARWDGRLVRVFNHRWQQIALHVRLEPGRFSTLREHLPSEKVSGVERGATWLLAKASHVGPQTKAWSEAMLLARGIEGVRVLQGLLALAKRHTSQGLEQACETALSYRVFRLRTLRELLKRRAVLQTTLPLLDEHPIIRPLTDYGGWLRAALAQGGRDQLDPQVPSPSPPSSFPTSLLP